MISASVNLLTVVVLCSWLHDIEARLRRMENPYR